MQLVQDVLGVSLVDMDFMTSQILKYKKEGTNLRVSRCGYTGEDGFEVSVPNQSVLPFVEHLRSKKDSNGNQIAKFIGLGARDSLRLEAGLCLYGHDLNEETSPVEGMLSWTISKRRKEKGGFIGYDRIKKDLTDGVSRKRTGFVVEGIPAREGAEIETESGITVGRVTSGGPSPSLKQNIGMGYIDVPYNKNGTKLSVAVRNKKYPLIVTKMPFVPHGYYKKI